MLSSVCFTLAAASLGELLGGWSPLALTLLIAGIILMIIEMFTPGLGISGALGGVAIIAAIILRAQTVLEGLILLLIILVILILFGVLLYISFKKGWISRSHITLDTAIDSQSTSLSEQADVLMGLEGVTVSYLRPAGIADFNGKRLDVMTAGEFIEAGARVKIVAVEGLKITVKAIS